MKKNEVKSMQKTTLGLRERQKQQRRAAILKSAKRLFDRHGLEETSMAAVAADAGVSTPTVFNYFGSRDELLLAIILEGHKLAVAENQARPVRSGERLSQDLCFLLQSYTERSLEIVGKSVWRYVDSTAIRQPESEFVKRYSETDKVLTKTIENLLSVWNCKPRRGGELDNAFLASVIFNHWNAHYTAYIKNHAMSLEEHADKLLPQIRALLDLIFEDA